MGGRYSPHQAHSTSPPKLQAFASLLDAQPPEVQEAFQFLLATAMHEAGKSEEDPKSFGNP
jgi:hypothetical protein